MQQYRLFPLITLLFLWGLSTPLEAAFPAQRVISLSPHTTEIAYAAGLGDKLIAVSAYSDYPPEAQQLEQVASWQGINVERILTLKPDLILAWREGNPQRVLDQLNAFGITILYFDALSLEEIAEQIRSLGHYSQYPQQAEQTAKQWLIDLNALKNHYQQLSPVRGFLQISTQPLFTSSSKTLQHQVLNLCGITNIFADNAAPWPQVSREQVLIRQPQVIVIGGSQHDITTIKSYWQHQLEIPVLAIDQDWFHRAGPRLLLAAESLCQQRDHVYYSFKN